MRAYADSSFLLRLLTVDPASARAAAEFRRLGRPVLDFSPLHALEVENALRQRVFHQRQSRMAAERAQIQREQVAAFARLRQWRLRGWLMETAVDHEAVFDEAREISFRHGEALGPRAIDVLHVACAKLAERELFLTFDERQLALAKAEGLRVSRPRAR